MEMVGISVMMLKEHEEKRAASEKDRERECQMVTTMYRDVEEIINANPTSTTDEHDPTNAFEEISNENPMSTTDEHDPTNAIEIELLQEVANEISNLSFTSADSITTVSDDALHVFGIDEHDLEQDGLGVHELVSQKEDFVADPNPFCAELESMGKFVCCFADNRLEDKSSRIDSFHTLRRVVDLPEDKPSGRILLVRKNDSLDRNDDELILNENGRNKKGILKENDGNASSNENSNGRQNRKEDSIIVHVGGSDTSTRIKEKVPAATDDECLLPGIPIFERLNSSPCQLKAMPSESRAGREKRFKRRTSAAKNESGKIDLEKGWNATEVDTETLVAVEMELGELVKPKDDPVASERKFGQEKSHKKWKNKARNETGKSGLKKVSNETEMASEILIAADVANGESVEKDVGEPKIVESKRKFELWKRLKEEGKNMADEPKVVESKRKFEWWKRLKEDSKNRGDHESGKNGLKTLSNESDEVVEMLFGAEDRNGKSGNVESGMMRMLENILLPPKEDASKKPSLRIANAKKDVRPDMSDRSTRTEDASRTDDGPETFKLVGAVLADDLSSIFESNAFLNMDGGDANAIVQAKVPATDDDFLLPGVAVHERLNPDLGEPKAVPSEIMIVPEKGFKKRASEATNEMGKIDLEMASNRTELDAETLFAVEIELGDLVEPKDVPVASRRKVGLKKGSRKSGLEKVSTETVVPTNEESLEICELSEAKVVELKRKSELWKRQKKRTNKAKSKSGTIGFKKPWEGTKVASETNLATKSASTLSESHRSFERFSANDEPLRVQESNGSWSPAFLGSMRMLDSALLAEHEEASHHPSLDETLRVSNIPVSVGKQKDERSDISMGGVSTDDASQTDDQAEASKLAVVVLSDDLSLIFEKPVWRATVDPDTGLPYYYHRLTRVTTWTAPPGFVKQ